MTIILDAYPLPTTGMVNLRVERDFEMHISATEARKKVDRWLLMHVSTQMGALEPTLCIGENVVWRVPVTISFSSSGHKERVGSADVDVQTGEIIDPRSAETTIITTAEIVASQLPPFKIREISAEYLATNLPRASLISIPD